MTRVHERVDAAAVVRAGARPAATTGARVDALRDECGLVVGGVVGVVSTLTGRDLFAELLRPIAGDVGAVSSMQAGWGEVAAASGAVGTNYRALARQVPAEWDGEAARAAVLLLDRVADAHERQREAADLVAEQLGHVVAVSLATAEVVCLALQVLDMLVQDLLVEAALGPAGWVAAAASSPVRVARMVRLVDRGVDAVQGLVRAVEAAVVVLRGVRALLVAVRVVVEAAAVAEHAVAGLRVDDTAVAGFR